MSALGRLPSFGMVESTRVRRFRAARLRGGLADEGDTEAPAARLGMSASGTRSCGWRRQTGTALTLDQPSRNANSPRLKISPKSRPRYHAMINLQVNRRLRAAAVLRTDGMVRV